MSIYQYFFNFIFATYIQYLIVKHIKCSYHTCRLMQTLTLNCLAWPSYAGKLWLIMAGPFTLNEIRDPHLLKSS